VDPTLTFRCWNPLDAVNPGFEAEEAVGPASLNPTDGFTNGTGNAFGEGEKFHFPAPPLGKPLIHAKKVSGKEPGLISASARPHFKNSGTICQRIRRD
jgi:hypothetical protein